MYEIKYNAARFTRAGTNNCEVLVLVAPLKAADLRSSSAFQEALNRFHLHRLRQRRYVPRIGPCRSIYRTCRYFFGLRMVSCRHAIEPFAASCSVFSVRRNIKTRAHNQKRIHIYPDHAQYMTLPLNRIPFHQAHLIIRFFSASAIKNTRLYKSEPIGKTCRFAAICGNLSFPDSPISQSPVFLRASALKIRETLFPITRFLPAIPIFPKVFSRLRASVVKIGF